jgi:DNA-binding IclR family transcriptional regulator
MNSHSAVLLYIAAHSEATIREIAMATGLTDRRIAQLIHDMVRFDLVGVNRSGRPNRYSINRQTHTRCNVF